MIRNLEVNQSKVIYLDQRRKQMGKDVRAERQKQARAKRRLKTRVGMAVFAVALTASAIAYNNHTKTDENISVEIEDNTIYSDITDLNDLNIVLVNDGVQDGFFDDLTNKLENDGISVKTVNGSYSVEYMDGSETYISLLDYNNDGKTKVIGQYTDRENQADPLAISLNACLSKNGLTDMGIQCGIKGYSDNGYQTLKESPVESALGENGANCFVTIAVDGNTDVDKFTDSFTEGLLRFQEYAKVANDFNLITRVGGGQTLDMIADKYNSSLEYLQLVNNMKNDRIVVDQTLKLSNYSDILTYRNMEINKNIKEKDERK